MGWLKVIASISIAEGDRRRGVAFGRKLDGLTTEITTECRARTPAIEFRIIAFPDVAIEFSNIAIVQPFEVPYPLHPPPIRCRYPIDSGYPIELLKPIAPRETCDRIPESAHR